MPTEPKRHRTYCKFCNDFKIFTWNNPFNKEESKLLCNNCQNQDSGYNYNEIEPKLVEEQRKRYKAMKSNKFKQMVGAFSSLGNYGTYGGSINLIECDAGQKQIDDLRKLEIEKYKQLEQEKHQLFLDIYSKINRNDKCPCGSNKKYKQCHLNQFK